MFRKFTNEYVNFFCTYLISFFIFNLIDFILILKQFKVFKFMILMEMTVNLSINSIYKGFYSNLLFVYRVLIKSDRNQSAINESENTSHKCPVPCPKPGQERPHFLYYRLNDKRLEAEYLPRTKTQQSSFFRNTWSLYLFYL